MVHFNIEEFFFKSRKRNSNLMTTFISSKEKHHHNVRNGASIGSKKLFYCPSSNHNRPVWRTETLTLFPAPWRPRNVTRWSRVAKSPASDPFRVSMDDLRIKDGSYKADFFCPYHHSLVGTTKETMKAFLVSFWTHVSNRFKCLTDILFIVSFRKNVDDVCEDLICEYVKFLHSIL